MYNNSLNISNPHQLIQREQNYVIDRKLVTVHSEDRDVTKFPNPNEFDIILPQQLTNVQSMRLVQCAFPSNYYTFSNEYQNTKFRFTVLLEGFKYPYCVTIQEGTYNPCQLAIELTNLMNNAVETGFNKFNVFYDEVGNKFWFGNSQNNFTLDFNVKMEYPEIKCNQPTIWYNHSRWGLPYYLGYEKKQYESINDPSKLPDINYLKLNIKQNGSIGDNIQYFIPIQPNVINLSLDRDMYMEVDKYNSYDELYPYTETNKSSFDNNAYSGKVNSAFAKIPIDQGQQQESRNLLLINFVQYEPPIERVSKLRFRFRFHDGRLVDFRGQDFNFTIEFNSLRNEILRGKNIRTPAMIPL